MSDQINILTSAGNAVGIMDAKIGEYRNYFGLLTERQIPDDLADLFKLLELYAVEQFLPHIDEIWMAIDRFGLVAKFEDGREMPIINPVLSSEGIFSFRVDKSETHHPNATEGPA